METLRKRRTDLRKSEFGSPFGNWEVFDFNCFARSHALKPGTYFMVGIIGDKHIRAGDFVASKQHYFIQPCFADGNADRRRYRRILLGVSQPEDKNDVALLKGRVYRAVDADNCELVFAENEWQDPEKVKALFQKMLGSEEALEVQKCFFNCAVSKGYFLEGERYLVWMSRLSDGRVLVCDYETGLPALYSCGTFEMV